MATIGNRTQRAASSRDLAAHPEPPPGARSTTIANSSDDLDFYVNGTLVYSDGSALAGSRSPISFTARRGATLRFVVRDTYGFCTSLTPLYLADGRAALAASGFNLGCGRPGGNQGVVYDTTFTIPF